MQADQSLGLFKALVELLQTVSASEQMEHGQPGSVSRGDGHQVGEHIQSIENDKDMISIDVFGSDLTQTMKALT